MHDVRVPALRATEHVPYCYRGDAAALHERAGSRCVCYGARIGRLEHLIRTFSIQLAQFRRAPRGMMAALMLSRYGGGWEVGAALRSKQINKGG
jgi:hypothetical protein